MKVDVLEEGIKVDVESEAETALLGRALARIARSGTVIGLVGNRGAGKTLLARALAVGLGVPAAEVTSPTFVLIQEYEGTLPVYHVDVYRLKSAEEFESLGPADYFESEGVVLVEWADKVEALMPSDTWWVAMEADPRRPHCRTLRLRLPASKATELVRVLDTY
jgi:tRNA threonylcarbamoyladenosine biosynthesis protein TsaE